MCCTKPVAFAALCCGAALAEFGKILGFLWLVNANDLYLKQHPSVGGPFPLLWAVSLDYSALPGEGGLQEKKKQGRNLQAQFELPIKHIRTQRGLWLYQWGD